MLIVLLCLLSMFSLHAKDVEEEGVGKQVPIGNFALPTSQQPGPLIGIGQTIVEKGEFLLYSFINQHVGTGEKSFTTIAPSLLYGISDKCAWLTAFPVAAKLQQGESVSRGIRDIFTQIEYVVFNSETKTTGNMITVLGNIFAPTGSFFKNPATGFGAPAFTLGTTATHQTFDWYSYISGAAIFPLKSQGNQTGNLYFYQAGVGRNIGYASEKWLAMILLEMSGWYKAKNTVMGATDPNSGSHQILLMPSLFFATQRLILQIGVAAFPLSDYFGVQGTISRYFFACNIGWKF